MDVQRFKEVIKKRNETHDEYDYGVEMCNSKGIQILSEDVASTIEYLKNECTAEKFFWISEIIDDVAYQTQSTELVECYKSLGDKFTEKAKTFRFDIVVECAQAALEGGHGEN